MRGSSGAPCIFYQGPGGFPYVFIITTQVITLVPIYDTTVVDHRVFVLGGNQEVPDCSATFEVGLDAISTTDLFDTFTKTLCVEYDNVTLGFDFIGGTLGNCGALVASLINNLTGRPVESFLHLVQSPFRILAFSKAFLKWSFTCWSNLGLLHTVLTLWERLWMTLNLAER